MLGFFWKGVYELFSPILGQGKTDSLTERDAYEPTMQIARHCVRSYQDTEPALIPVGFIRATTGTIGRDKG